MRPNKYKEPRVHTGELRTPVTFYQYQANDGPEPGEEEKKTLYKSWAKIDEVWMRDLEIAKQNGTESDLTITIRDPLDDYRANHKHYISVDAPEYKKSNGDFMKYNIKQVYPDLQDRQFLKIVAGLDQDEL